MNGISIHSRETPERPLPFHHVGKQQKNGTLQPGKGLSPEPHHAGILMSDSQPPEWRNTFVF